MSGGESRLTEKSVGFDKGSGITHESTVVFHHDDDVVNVGQQGIGENFPYGSLDIDFGKISVGK